MHSNTSWDKRVYLEYNAAPRHNKVTGLTIDAPRVKWEWHSRDVGPSVDVFKTVRVDPHMSVHREEKHQWTIRYPEEAPIGTGYELIVDVPPTLTPEQSEELNAEKAALVKVWLKEKEVQNTLLSLWVPSHEYEKEITAKGDGSRYIEYTHTMYIKGAPFNIELNVTLEYVSSTPRSSEQYKAFARVYIVLGDTYIPLDTINLPIVDGTVCNAELIEYLECNPLSAANLALCNIASAIGTGHSL